MTTYIRPRPKRKGLPRHRRERRLGSGIRKTQRMAAWRRRIESEVGSSGVRVPPSFQVGQHGTKLKDFPVGRIKIDSAIAAYRAWCREQGITWDPDTGSRAWTHQRAGVV